jgi:hypothetical protein
MRTVSLVLASSFVVTALTAGSALAERRTYPGMACQTTGSISAVAKRDEFGRILNDSTSFNTIMCPLDTRTEHKKAAIAYVNDARTNAEVECLLLSLDREGDVRHSLRRGSGNPTAGRAVQLNFEPGLDVTANGFVFLHCLVPGKNPDGQPSGIASYLGFEQD